VKKAVRPSPQAEQKNHHVRGMGNFFGKFPRQGHDSANRGSVFVQMENHLKPIVPVFAPHLFYIDYQFSFHHGAPLHFPGSSVSIKCFCKNVLYFTGEKWSLLGLCWKEEEEEPRTTRTKGKG
jgi:hypothetical protein